MLASFRDFFREANQKAYLDYFIVLIIALVLFSWLQASPALPEPDSFYHAKMAQILSQGQVLQQFPWLAETGLAGAFVDHHFLYHLLLVPFVLLFNPLIGVKIATVIFATLLVLTVYFLFKKFHIRTPFIFVAFLLMSQPWLFRASLVKAPMVFLIFLLLAFYFLTHGRWLALAVVSFLSVWLYAGWPLLPFLILIYLFFYWLLEKFRTENSIWYSFKQFFNRQKKSFPWRALSYGFGGALAGLVINPYFPKNLGFYWQQLVEISIINYQKVIGVGGEWYPYGLLKLAADAPLACSLLAVGLMLFALTFKKQSIYAWTWLVLALIFFGLTLKSQRYVEFFIPVTVIFAAFCFSDYLKKLSRFHLGVLMNVGWQALFLLFGLVLAAGFLFKLPADLAKVKQDIKNGWPLTHYRAAAGWLEQNAPAGAIVFNADWDDFPFLFYYNSRNYYLTGLDPTFMYRRDKNKYQEYLDITLGKNSKELAKTIKNQFKADYVFLDKNHGNLKRILDYLKGTVKVYEDGEALIYKVND